MGLLGKDSLTITDITDVNPIRLDLASSQPIYQTKRAGEKYEPDYTSSPLIITPSLYLGTEEVSGEKYQGHISFFINNKEVTKSDEEKGYILEIVDNKSILKITKNLTENILVKVNITDILDERTGVVYKSISENLSFYLLSYDSSGYTAFIDSNDGRYDFSADNTNDIQLTAHLYLGNAELTLTTSDYEWSKSSRLSFGKDENEEEIYTKNDKTLTIERSDIHSHENFVCKMTYEGVTYIATCAIDDRTDLYTSAIISDAPLVMTPKFNTATLTCKIFRNGEEVNTGDINYSWILYKNDSGIINLANGENKTLNIALGENNIPKDNFSIYCTAVIDEKYTTVSYISISYSEPYTPILTPKTIFIPANSDGSYKGSEEKIEKTFSFFLQGDNGGAIESNLSGFSISRKDITMGEPTSGNNKYTIPFSIELSQFKNYDVSELFELSYAYKGQTFNEEFYIVKSVQGSAGKDGVDGTSYSLILSNDYHRFAGGEVYAVGGQEVSTNIRFFKGDDELNIKSLKINDKLLETNGVELGNGLTAKINVAPPAKNIQITFMTNQGKLKEGGAIPIEATVTINGTDKTFITMFAYDINYEGNSYFLSFTNGTSISYLPSKDTFTPNKIEFYAYSRQNGKGENIPYTKGQVYVSVDGGDKIKLTGNSAFYSYSINTNIKNSITFYLYNSLATDGAPEETYLMDRETIPILTSLEGAEIGGDNLLRFTRTLQWDVQNSNKDTILINKDIDTSIANFNFSASTGDISGSNKICVLASPEIYIEKELKDKTFCISFYFKNDSENYFDTPLFVDGNVHTSIYAYNGTDQLDAKSILYISNTSSNNAKVENEEIIEKGKWVRVYQTFNLNIFTSNTLSKATHYKIKIIGVISDNSNFVYNFSIKKPKLEVGNTLTSWSMATNDILFEDLNVDLNNLNSQSLVEVLNNQIMRLNQADTDIGYIANGKISFSIKTAEGGIKSFVNLEDFSNYINTNINTIITNTNSKYDSINNSLTALQNENGKFFELKNNIRLGYDDKQNFKPYLLFEVIGGENKDKINSMRLTTEDLSFWSGTNKLAYFGSNSMTIKRAKIENQFYIGTDNNGYLLVTTTPQGIGFIWSKDFVE